jgi:hypothetical protein
LSHIRALLRIPFDGDEEPLRSIKHTLFRLAEFSSGPLDPGSWERPPGASISRDSPGGLPAALSFSHTDCQ